MEYQSYLAQAQRAAQLVESREYDEAVALYQQLLASDLADLDKAMTCLNLATVYDKMRQPERALAWHDRAMAYERPYSRFFAAEQKAVYLSARGRDRESLSLYEYLLARPYLAEADKERVRHNIAALRQRLGESQA